MQLTQLLSLAGLVATSRALPHTLTTRATCTPQGISTADAEQVTSAFSTALLTPNIISAFNPTVQVSTIYGSKAATLGNVFSTLETATEPTISFTGESSFDTATTKYVILFVDPDAPGPTSDPATTPGIASYFLHLAVYNASPSCITSSNNGGGTTIAMYKPLTPLSVTNHRYVQLVYRQPAGYTPSLELSYLAGGFFDLKGFVSRGGLTLVGGNFLYQGIGSLGAVGK